MTGNRIIPFVPSSEAKHTENLNDSLEIHTKGGKIMKSTKKVIIKIRAVLLPEEKEVHGPGHQWAAPGALLAGWSMVVPWELTSLFVCKCFFVSCSLPHA